MIKYMAIGKVVLDRTPLMPPMLIPLISAAAAGEPLEPALGTICAHLGFDSFMFGMSANPQVNHESQIYAFTTLPIEWVARYDQMDYVEIDPRVLKTRDIRIPFIWDSESERGLDPRTDAFLDDAACARRRKRVRFRVLRHALSSRLDGAQFCGSRTQRSPTQ